ncbi:MAG TPA: asparagine synthase-related protein, partial [Gemmatimonadaceae bacterium]|nr:asparagine synthase-related protein [Gemmatimonadaceae bacterium]
MTAIAAKMGAGAPGSGVATISRMLNAMRTRGDREEVGELSNAAIGTAHFDWEPGESRVARHGAIVVVADATLYYRDDLRRAISANGVAQFGGSAAELIAAAYAAFGRECVARLEGDFAFVLFDSQRESLFAARDFGGKRTLYFAAINQSITLASTIGGVTADARVSSDLNLAHIAATAAGIWAHAPDTCYRDVMELPAGYALTWDARDGVSVSRFWNPPAELARSRESPDDAARQLLDLLTRATAERLASQGATAVTLSGGWDSTAVYGAGQNALRARTTPRTLHAVSISYPEGDVGREDDFITEATTMWKSTPSWIGIDDIQMFGEASDSVRAATDAARARDEPFAHPYETWNRALARAASSAGAHVVLDGSGGDQLFQVSDIYLADLFATGRWLEVLRQWRSRDGRGVRDLYRWAVRPVLP